MDATAGPAGGFPALGVILALFMAGYLVWTTDRLASLARARTATAGRGGPALAPKLAACGKIAMSATMGYMLLLMI